jgi:hypothetical protein
MAIESAWAAGEGPAKTNRRTLQYICYICDLPRPTYLLNFVG